MINRKNLSDKIDELAAAYKDTLPFLIKNLSSSLLFSGLSVKEQERMVGYFQNLSVVIQKHRDELDQLKKDVPREGLDVY